MSSREMEILKDNPKIDRLIEVHTKALRRGVDVWGDAAGTAPAVTSATRLGLRFLTGFSLTTKVFLGRSSGAPHIFPSGTTNLTHHEGATAPHGRY